MHIGETGASCYNFQLKSLFVKQNMVDALLFEGEGCGGDSSEGDGGGGGGDKS